MNKLRVKNLSRFFWDDEILAKGSDGTIYLKEGVKRRFYMFDETEQNASQINGDLIQLEKLKGFSDDCDDEE